MVPINVLETEIPQQETNLSDISYNKDSFDLELNDLQVESFGKPLTHQNEIDPRE
jgi:hypothetical protein